MLHNGTKNNTGRIQIRKQVYWNHHAFLYCCGRYCCFGLSHIGLGVGVNSKTSRRVLKAVDFCKDCFFVGSLKQYQGRDYLPYYIVYQCITAFYRYFFGHIISLPSPDILTQFL
jgi:hypothetical protein